MAAVGRYAGCVARQGRVPRVEERVGDAGLLLPKRRMADGRGGVPPGKPSGSDCGRVPPSQSMADSARVWFGGTRGSGGARWTPAGRTGGRERRGRSGRGCEGEELGPLGGGFLALFEEYLIQFLRLSLQRAPSFAPVWAPSLGCERLESLHVRVRTGRELGSCGRGGGRGWSCWPERRGTPARARRVLLRPWCMMRHRPESRYLIFLLFAQFLGGLRRWRCWRCWNRR